LVRFEFSTTQAYILEFGDQYIRFYRNNGVIREAATNIADITQADPAVVTTVAHGYSDGDVVYLSNIVSMTELNGKNFTVANKNDDDYELSGVDSSAYDEYGASVYLTDESGNQITDESSNDLISDQATGAGIAEKIYEISTTYLEADLFDLRFTQSVDILYITHEDYEPAKLSRTGHTAWTLTDLTNLDGPYLSTNATATTITPSAATGSVTLTASAITGINSDTGFQTTDIGRVIRLKEGAIWGWATITARASTTSVTATVSSTLTNTDAKVTWRLGLWSDTTGFPSCVTFYEDRLVFAGVTQYPQRLDGSRTGDYENFAPTDMDGTVTDSHAIGFTLNSDAVNAIHWLLSDEKGLLAGTSGGEWIIRASTLGEGLSPTNVSAKNFTRYGSAAIQAVIANKSVIFAQRSKEKIRELRYFFEQDGFEAPDLTILAEHIARGGLIEFARQVEPQSLVWAARDDGTLVGMTYERDAEVVRVGWHRHVLGGAGDSDGNPPDVESVATIPSSDGKRDELWMVVKRFIDGAAVRYIEYLTPHFIDTTEQEDAFFVDSGLTYDSNPTTSFSGLDHLEGETLSVLADGAVRPDATVSDGAITLDTEASVVHVGYGYNSDGQILRLEAGSADGTALGKIRRIHKVGMLVHRTLGLKFGMSFDELDTVIFRSTTDESGEPPDLYTGIISETVEADYDYENQFCWRQDQPLPGTILAIAPRMVTNDD